MNIALARNIFAKQWMLEANYLQSMLPLVVNMIENKVVDAEFKSVESTQFVLDASTAQRRNESIDTAPKGSIAVIELKGALMKNDQNCGPVGTATIGSWIQQADQNPNIDGIILSIDSPGGTVDGTEEMARIVAQTKKPIATFVNGMMASAAEWIGSQADTIIASGETSTIGSIGTMCSMMDVKPILEKAGVKFHEAYASKSSDKNKAFNDMLNGDYTDLINNHLNPLNDVFTKAVTKARAGKIDLAKEDVLTGKMYMAKDAKKYGLIDSIGTMADAVAFIQNSKKNKMNSSKTNATQFPKVCSTLGFTEGFESTAEGVHLSIDSIQALEDALATTTVQEEQAANTDATVADLQAQLQAQTEALNTMTTRVNDLTAELTTIKNSPVSRGSTPAATATEELSPEANPKGKYVPDGSEKLGAKYGIHIDHKQL